MAGYEYFTKPGEYICYCDEVTEEQMVQSLEQGARSVKEMAAATGAMQHCDCVHKNPKGR